MSSSSVTSLWGFLPHLPSHLHIFLASVITFFAAQLSAGPVLRAVAPRTWNGLKGKDKQELGTKVACE